MKPILTLIVATLLLSTSGCRKKNKIRLEKIIYHTSPCFGNCPTYQLEIDSNKNARLFAERVYKKGPPLKREEDLSRTGFFKGKLQDSIFNKVSNQLDAAEIDELEFDGVTCCDGSVRTLIVYYNGKKKVLESMFPPDEARNLLKSLDDICRNNSFPKTHGSFKIEGQ